MFLYIQAIQLYTFTMDEKCQLGLYGCYFELEKSNQQVAMSVGMQIFDGAICCIDAEPWNNQVCQHTVLP